VPAGSALSGAGASELKYAARSARSWAVSALAKPFIVGCQRLPERYSPSAATMYASFWPASFGTEYFG
jgi:hypothetical protein